MFLFIEDLLGLRNKMNLYWFERPHYWHGNQINPYYWYWHDYRCRLEPWTFEWRRYVKKWWWVILIKTAIVATSLIWLLLFPLSDASPGIKITVIIIGVLVVVFYAWLLLHLGGFAEWIVNKLKRR